MGHSTTQKVTAATLLVALGIIYGDIGTSPLYVMKAIVDKRAISELLVYGGISCVFWTLTFQTTFKYIILTLAFRSTWNIASSIAVVINAKLFGVKTTLN